MIREYLLYGFEALTIVLAGILLTSTFLYTSKGLVTRRTLIISFICFVLLMISIWITAALSDASIAMPALVCIGGITVFAGISFALKYFALPYFDSHIKNRAPSDDKEE